MTSGWGKRGGAMGDAVRQLLRGGRNHSLNSNASERLLSQLRAPSTYLQVAGELDAGFCETLCLRKICSSTKRGSMRRSKIDRKQNSSSTRWGSKNRSKIDRAIHPAIHRTTYLPRGARSKHALAPRLSNFPPRGCAPRP